MKKISILLFISLNFTLFSQNFQWAKGIGGTTSDLCKSMKTDSQGNIYITGDFKGTVDFDPGPNTHLLISAGIYDVFVLKLDPAGNFLWAKSMGGPNTDQGLSVDIDSY